MRRFFGNVAVHLNKVKSDKLRHEAYSKCLSPNQHLEEEASCAQSNCSYSILLSYQSRPRCRCQGYRRPCSSLITPDYPSQSDYTTGAKREQNGNRIQTCLRPCLSFFDSRFGRNWFNIIQNAPH